MSVTITLPDELANGLSQQAKAQRVSLQQWATRILEEALDDQVEDTKWFKLNSRRLGLIAKEYATGLTDAEAAELADLQEAAAKACEPRDRTLLKRLTACEELANYPFAPNHE